MAFGFSFSWKRALGITAARRSVAKELGIPTTKQGAQRKIGKSITDIFLETPKRKRKPKDNFLSRGKDFKDDY